MPRATTLQDAYDVLDPTPIDFEHHADYYVEPPERVHDDQTRSLKPLDRIRRAIRTTRPAKVFLAGHVGAGKSTQLRRLATDPDITARFTVVPVQLEATELPFLDAAQLQFHVARALFEHCRALELLKGKEADLRKHIVAMNRRVFGEQGFTAAPETSEVELNLFFVSLRQSLRVSEHARKRFRDFAETERTALHDLVRLLSYEMELALHQAGRPSTLLVVIDDLDKVRAPEQQHELFHVNLDSLLSHRFRVIYTLPTAVSLEPSRGELLRTVEHMYPERVLDKVQHFDPMKAFLDDAWPFFRDALFRRVEEGLFSEEGAKIAMAYSGGVVRDFFRLLKEASAMAEQSGQPRVDVLDVRGAVREERLRWTRSLAHEDYDALLDVHRTHDRRDTEQHHRLLDLGLMLECYNDDTWYEAHPLLWASIERRAHHAT